jgi:hypothetical protein
MFSKLRIFIACVVGASALQVVDEKRVLLLGCSLDRNALLDFCDGHGEQTFDPVQTVRCFNNDLNVRMGYLFHPGVGDHGDLHKPTAIAKGLSTNGILTKYAKETAQYLLKGSPELVVVDSSLWDLLVWRLGTAGDRGAGPNPSPKPVTEERVQQWCQHDLPLLMNLTSEIFPTSRIAFRTAPTIDHTPHHEKFEKHDIEMLHQCIKSSTNKGMLFGKYEIIDYYEIVKNLIDRNVPHLFRDDGYHPGWYPSALYINDVLRSVGLNPKDPPEPGHEDSKQRIADRSAKFEAEIQGDPYDLDLI